MSTTPPFALLPDSPEARLLVELSSYADDLSDASSTIHLALEVGSESPLWSPLTSYAVVAYMRAFGHSNVRSGLLDHLSIPDAIAETHDLIRTYRNTTIAHSQSELSIALPMATLVDGQVSKAFPINVRHHLPPSTARRIAEAIEVISDLVEDLIDPLSEHLTARYAAASPATVAAWPIPDFRNQPVEAFTAASRRTKHPRFTFYWDVIPTGLEAPTA